MIDFVLNYYDWYLGIGIVFGIAMFFQECDDTDASIDWTVNSIRAVFFGVFWLPYILYETVLQKYLK